MVGRCKDNDTKGCVDVVKGLALGRASSDLRKSKGGETPALPLPGCGKTGRARK
ncbi:hypothetical protein GGH18_003529 [Coemansia sp. RSA 530]|nr:hypothetical protein GGH18_003529 [Coemansia sp. RSA 530]